MKFPPRTVSLSFFWSKFAPWVFSFFVNSKFFPWGLSSSLVKYVQIQWYELKQLLDSHQINSSETQKPPWTSCLFDTNLVNSKATIISCITTYCCTMVHIKIQTNKYWWHQFHAHSHVGTTTHTHFSFIQSYLWTNNWLNKCKCSNTEKR